MKLSQPSLVRRLVLAQLGLMGVLWLGSLLWSYQENLERHNEQEFNEMRAAAALALPLGAAYQEPEALRAALLRLDAFLDASAMPRRMRAIPGKHIHFWWDGRLIHRSPGATDLPADIPLGQLVDLQIDAWPWHTYVAESPDHRARFAMQLQAYQQQYQIKPLSWAWLLLPLVGSLPLLLLPAWASVRLALRPLARLSGEIAARAPDDLRPLVFQPRHRELLPLTEATNQWLRGLREARERERRFAADAAHELRTPIAAMRIHAEALQAHGLAPANQELLVGLLASNRRAGHLVAQLLALARSEADAAPALRDLDLAALVQHALASLAGAARERGVTLELEMTPGLVLHGDADALHSLVENLGSNAIRFAPAGSRVLVQAWREKGHVLLSVSDAGPGIAPAWRDRVFERFFRGPDQPHSGSGLGLAIVKAVADRHGAQVELRPGLDGAGLSVWLRFPQGPPGA